MCVRYHYDTERRMRFTTVELITEQAPWSLPTRMAGTPLMVGVRVGTSEAALQGQVEQVGGRWNYAIRFWEMAYSRAIALGLQNCIEKWCVSNSRHPQNV